LPGEAKSSSYKYPLPEYGNKIQPLREKIKVFSIFICGNESNETFYVMEWKKTIQQSHEIMGCSLGETNLGNPQEYSFSS
jgi:hypothetical protein